MKNLKNTVKDNRFTMLKMNDEVFLLRKKVIDIIYQIKKDVPNLPRIEVRIIDKKPDCNILGYGRFKTNCIHITKEALGEKYLYKVVLHEILHAVLAIEHSKNCPLMQPVIDTSLDNRRALDIFVGYFSVI